MRSKAIQSKNKFLRIATLPFRFLGKAGDVYVRGITSCTGRRAHYAQPDYLPRSCSAVSSTSRGPDSEDFRELLRAASTKSLGIDAEAAAHRGPKVLPKSCSMGMGMEMRRIDEDEACEFGEDEEAKRKSTDMISRRSRSYVIRTVK